MRPAVGASNPVSILIVVDLPAPFGPRNPKNCPGSTARFTCSTATSSPNRRVNPSVNTAASLMMVHDSSTSSKIPDSAHLPLPTLNPRSSFIRIATNEEPNCPRYYWQESNDQIPLELYAIAARIIEHRESFRTNVRWRHPKHRFQPFSLMGIIRWRTFATGISIPNWRRTQSRANPSPTKLLANREKCREICVTKQIGPTIGA